MFFLIIPHEILIPQKYRAIAYELYEHLCFYTKRVKILFTSNNQISPLEAVGPPCVLCSLLRSLKPAVVLGTGDRPRGADVVVGRLTDGDRWKAKCAPYPDRWMLWRGIKQNEGRAPGVGFQVDQLARKGTPGERAAWGLGGWGIAGRGKPRAKS